MEKKIVIIGAGISGCIAYHAFRQESPLIVEATAQKETIATHKAVMRLRDPDVARFIGANYKEIEVQKGIYYKGQMIAQPDILLNNQYSLKLYDELEKRSVLKPGSSKRYILEDGFPAPENINWNSKVKKIHSDDKGNWIEFHDNGLMEYDYCISTLPMPLLYNKIVGHPDLTIKFKSTSVSVLRFDIKIPSCVNQTILFPDPNTPIYRITIQNKSIIVESIHELKFRDMDHISGLIEGAFGLDIQKYNSESEEISNIPIGKIRSIDEESRLRYILWLTDNFNIFSFGRYAIWKPVRTDELMDDILKIKRIIMAKGIEGKYRGRLEK